MQHLTFSLQVNHVTKTKYNPFYSKLYLFHLAWVIIIYVINKPNEFRDIDYPEVDIPMSIYLVVTITLICQAHYIFNIIIEMADACHIRVFKVKSQSQMENIQLQIDSQNLFSSRGEDKGKQYKADHNATYELPALNDTEGV
mmetsp:Transcript_9729/g.14815  ORF Transcript_9729/g.14815 Transcript_9729/m.14815 type:complete len:142 (+) Transcript_9729:1058-1483(+)